LLDETNDVFVAQHARAHFLKLIRTILMFDTSTS